MMNNICNKKYTKYWCLFGIGTAFLIFSGIIFITWPNIAVNILNNELVLRDGSSNYKNWIETPIPMYLEIKLFNWTNTEQYENQNVKPHFEEFGPYVFFEKHKRVNLTWHNNNDTISFAQIRTWHFVPERSNGSLDDVITNLNVISASLAYRIRDESHIVKIFGDYLLNSRGGSLFVTKTVREFLFDGYDDKLLTLLREFKMKEFNIPFKKFGWFVERNESSSYDGLFTMFTGKDNIEKVGKLDRWNGENHTSFKDSCGQINGTTGELWPPRINPIGNITLYVTDMCRSITLRYADTVNKYGIVGSKYVGDETVFDNGQNYPPNTCFCAGDPSSCPDLLTGVQNVSDCRFGAPAFVSYPHFYLADPNYLKVLDGLQPNKDEHEFFIALEPSTGIPVSIRASMQINILLQPISGLALYKNVPHLMVPMLWFHQTAELTKDLADQTKTATMLPYYGQYAGFGFVGLAIALLLIGSILLIKEYKNRPQLEHTNFNNDEDEQNNNQNNNS